MKGSDDLTPLLGKLVKVHTPNDGMVYDAIGYIRWVEDERVALTGVAGRFVLSGLLICSTTWESASVATVTIREDDEITVIE